MAWAGGPHRLAQRAIAAARKLLAGVHAVEPEFFRNVGAEVGTARPWIDRAVVLAYALATGLLVVGSTLLAEGCSELFDTLRHDVPGGRWMTLLWTPALTVAIVWYTRERCPGAGGSGIPQVMRALDDDITDADCHWLVSFRLGMRKIVLVAGGMLAGLSIGREGPMVQVGAGVMGHARHLLSPGAGIDRHDLMVAGAAAGIAATFNTPLGGVIFALEKLTRRRGISHSTLMIACIVLSGMVSISFFGNLTYFGQLRVQKIDWSLLGPGLLVTLGAGLGGGLFARLMVVSIGGLGDRLSVWRRSYPLRFAAGCGAAVAVIGLVTGGATGGAGYAPTRALLEGHSELPGVYTLLKFCATWLSSWSGAPGGMFAPSLAIGAGIGHDVALLSGVSKEAAIPLIAIGMVGFLSATTQGPITAFIIVMEMISGHAMVLSLMAASMIAGGVGRLVSKPMYHELAGLLPIPRPAPAPAPAPAAPPP